MTWATLLRDDLRREYGDRGPVAVLATVTAAGEPAARCVICRHVGDDGRLSFTTDLRSDKIAHLRNQPCVELVFWMPTLRRQYRVAGDMQIITGPAAAGEWADFRDETRRTFFGLPPGEPFAPTPITADLSNPPATFAVLELIPDRVESLDLTQSPHVRLRWARKDQWCEHRVNP
jgi:pyridoxamine 5'-phosphate oxidase